MGEWSVSVAGGKALLKAESSMRSRVKEPSETGNDAVFGSGGGAFVWTAGFGAAVGTAVEAWMGMKVGIVGGMLVVVDVVVVI